MPDNTKTAKMPVKVDVQTVTELLPGDKFRANILNKTLEGMTIRLSGGDVINAKALNSPDVRIGDTVVFLVVENNKNQILLEMVKPGNMGGNTALSKGVIHSALEAAEMPVTPENTRLVMDLAYHGKPIAPKTLQTAAFFMYYNPEMKLNFEQVKFLLDEGFPPEAKTIDVYQKLIDKTTSYNKNISYIYDITDRLPDTDIKREILHILSQDNKMFVDIHKDGLNELCKFYNDINKLVKKLLTIISENENNEPLREMHRPLVEIRQSIEFMNQINETKEYMQIPFMTENQPYEAELHVFKDKRGKKPDQTNNTALIALDYPELGHVQVYIQRTGNRVQLQFRAETSKILNILAGDSYKLNNILSAKGFSVSGFNFKKITEKFDIHAVPEGQKTNSEGITKYSVDVRV